MGAWEAECARLDSERIAGKIEFLETVRIAMEAYQHVFEKYCSKTRAIRRESLTYSTPLYEPENEEVTDVIFVSPDVANIHTQQLSGHRKHQLYRLVLEEGHWKLLERLIVMEDGVTVSEEL